MERKKLGVDSAGIYKHTNVKYKYNKQSLKMLNKKKLKMEEKKLKKDAIIKSQQQKYTLILYVINRISEQYKYAPDKLRIVKILYLLDRKFKENTSRRLSDYNYVLEKLGPLAWEILDNLEELKSANMLSNFDNLYNFKITFISSNDSNGIKSISDTIERDISKKDIEFIFEKSKNLNGLLNYVHSLPEVKKAKLHEPIIF